MLGGRDLLAGGTWLAVNEHGLVAGLTNRPSQDGRDAYEAVPGRAAARPRRPHAARRARWRTSPTASARSDYNPAWLLVGDRESLYYLEVGEDAPPEVEALGPGVHVLANGPLHETLTQDRPGARPPARSSKPGRWPRTTGARSVLADHTVPEAVAAEEPDPKRPTELAAACVHTAEFGTRSSALIQVRPDGHRRWVADGPPCEAPVRLGRRALVGYPLQGGRSMRRVRRRARS